MKRSECIMGTKVKLTSGNFIPTFAYPMVGSKYECEGKIIAFFNDLTLLGVAWTNGTTNTLKTRYFSAVKNKPYKSIW